MKRRSFVQAAAAATALGVPHLSGLAQQSVTLKFHTFMAPLSNVWLLMHKPWMEKVERESGGRIKFEAYPAMQLGGGPAQLYDQARDGVVDVVWTLPGTTAGRFPRIEVFELPFMMNNAEATSKAYWEYFQTNCPDEFKETHVLALQVRSGNGALISLSEISIVEERPWDGAIYHKDLLPLDWVSADAVGTTDSPLYGMFEVVGSLGKSRPEGMDLEIQLPKRSAQTGWCEVVDVLRWIQ